MNRPTLEALVIETVQALNAELEQESLQQPTASTPLYGGDGCLDSLALVSLVTDLEEAIALHYQRDLVLADDKAMSQRRSPFNTVASLTAYIQTLLDETEASHE